jgi:hypothetical protein
VGGTLKTEILREEALELALEGFLPFCELSERPQEEKRSLFRELGLPYVSDPAVTRHLAAFLASAGLDTAGPDAILFNGGFVMPDLLRERVADVVGSWYGHRPLVLENRDHRRRSRSPITLRPLHRQRASPAAVCLDVLTSASAHPAGRRRGPVLVPRGPRRRFSTRS